MGHDGQHIHRHGHVHQQVASCLVGHQAPQSAAAALHRLHAAVQIFLAHGAGLHAGAQQQRLLQHQHEHSGDEKHGKTGVGVEEGHLIVG